MHNELLATVMGIFFWFLIFGALITCNTTTACCAIAIAVAFYK